jgi:signal transduction histidine kinase
MARTWSAPQRGSVVGVSDLTVTAVDLGAVFDRGTTHRGTLLILGAVLTAAGAIAPYLDSQFLSTLLFVAGAGLTALFVLNSSPREVAKASQPSSAATAKSVSALANRPARQVRFPELLAGRRDFGADTQAWAKLTAHMSHELRTPLNAVLGFSEIMTDEVFGPLGTGYANYARDIHESGRLLLKSTEDALAITALLTSVDRGDTQSCRLRRVIDDAMGFAAADLASRSIGVTLELKGDVEIIGDHQAMRQMIVNVVLEVARNAATGSIMRIEMRAGGDVVDLRVVLISEFGGRKMDEGFGIILARTICEFSGATLTCLETQSGERAVRVRLQRADQSDLFAAA